jgi:hypothetical protein
MAGVEGTVKYTHSRDRLTNPLNINLNINNERQDYTTDTVYVCGEVLVRERVNEGD